MDKEKRDTFELLYKTHYKELYIHALSFVRDDEEAKDIVTDVYEYVWKNFDKATSFAFHSQFPYMFYAVDNKVYLHNLGTNTTFPMDNVVLGDNEEVTMLKFNLYRQCSLDDLNNQSDEFMARQYELMVGSYNHSVLDNNGGKLGFYPVDGVNNSVTKRTEYSGFAKIKDVVYRERR